MIIVYPWKHAPDALRALSTNGGDEDWVALVPAGLVQEYDERGWPMWLEHPAFGVCDVDRYEIDDGQVVVIGSHA